MRFALMTQRHSSSRALASHVLRFGQAEEDEVEENMRDEIPYEMETDFGVNDLPYLRVPIFRVSNMLQTIRLPHVRATASACRAAGT